MSGLTPRAGHRWPRPAGRLGTLALAALILPSAAIGAEWTQPAVLAHCAVASLPWVVFPSADPRTRGGPGAILWNGDPAACAAGDRSGSGVGLAPIGADDVAGPPQSPGLSPGPPVTLGAPVATLATGDGRVVIATGLGLAPASPVGVLEGRAGATFGRPIAIRARAAPLAGATSYLGEIALATVSAGRGQIELRLQRPGSHHLAPRVVLSAPRTVPSALAVGLDYRGDALVVWASDGWIYRRVLRASGRREATERVAPSPPGPHLQALISDDNRGIVAWTTDVTGGGGATITRVFLDASRSGVHFGRPRLVEQFRNPPGLGLPDGSLRLVRLASEAVMMAWTGMSDGRYVVRAATVSLSSIHPATVVSGPSGDGVLADLATGPHNEAVALWSSAPRLARGFDVRQEQILAARGVFAPPGLAVFSAPEAVAGPGQITTPRAAVDPATGNTVAVWRSLGPDPGIAYATRLPANVPRRTGPAVHVGSPPAGWPITAAGLAALIVLCALAVFEHARRPSPAGRAMLGGQSRPADLLPSSTSRPIRKGHSGA